MRGDRGLFESAVRAVFRGYFRLVHRATIEGAENIPRDGSPLVIVANHGSLLDGPLLWSFLPLRFRALISREIADLPVLRTVLTEEYVVRVSTLQSYSLRHILGEVAGRPLLVFPEGQRSRTGSLMKIYDGTGFIACRTGARLLPVHIEGNYNVLTSRSPDRRRWFGKLRIVIGKPELPRCPADIPARERRRLIAGRIYALLAQTAYLARNRPSTLPAEIVRKCRENRGRPALKDVTKRTLSYGKVLAGAFLFSRRCAAFEGTHVGVLLPNLSVTVLLLAGLLLARKVPAMLNYAGGTEALAHMLELADIRTVVTSREFLEKIGIPASSFAGRTVVYLEDLHPGAGEKLFAVVKSFFSGRWYRAAQGEEKEKAVVLFTSGSEGVPKGVVLSHENILSNIRQCLVRIDLHRSDYLLNALPVFHSFGLTVGVFLPLFVGAKSFLYVSPLHYRVVPELAYDEGCTVLLGTNVFLRGYGIKGNPYDFYRVRYVYCGAEALQESVFELYAKKFGIRVLTGYGATECSPVISMNNPLEYEYGSAGTLLPGMECRIASVEGITGGAGRLQVRGKNVMLGYLKNEAANRRLREGGGWYDTGDVVEIDGRGFLKIVGRLKRFAKVSGEMVSLTAVEEALAGALGPRASVALLALPDPERGERLVLVTDRAALTLKTAREALRAKGLPQLGWPRELRRVERIPRLGTGKPDYVRLRRLIAEKPREKEPAVT